MIQISFCASTQSSHPQGWQRPLQIMLSLVAEGDVWSHPPAPAAVLGTTALPKRGVGLADTHTDSYPSCCKVLRKKQLLRAEGCSRCCSRSRGQEELRGIYLSATQGMLLPHSFPSHSQTGITAGSTHPRWAEAQGATCPNPPASNRFVSGSCSSGLEPHHPLVLLSHPTASPVLTSTCFPLEHCLFVGSVSSGQQESPCSVNTVLSLNSSSLSLIKY